MLAIQRNEIILCLALAGLLIFASPGKAEDGQSLAPGDGRGLVIENCTACHSTKIILQNRMTRERWDETITWMQEKQGLWTLGNAVRGKILDYLAMTQGPEAQAVKPGPGKPERPYRFDYPPNPL